MASNPAGAGAGGLQLLLSTYSDSDNDNEDGNDGGEENISVPALSTDLPIAAIAKCREKLPVPGDIQNMFSDKTDAVNNNSEDHGGRIRSFAHVRGNWASFVCLPFHTKNPSLAAMVEIIQASLEEFPDQPKVTIIDEFHLSLSKTVVLHHHWIEPFIRSLKKCFLTQKRFDVIFTEFNVYLNEEKTRTFIGMNIFATDTLFNLIKDCDTCLTEYGLEKYYENASFHVSLAWCVGDQDKWMRSQLLPLLNSKLDKILDADSSLQASNVQSVQLKTGNRVFKILLEA
jgi:2'-5' RNA ligase